MPLFDEQEILARVGNDLDFMAEMVRVLATDGPAVLDEIRCVAASGDAPGVRWAAHALRGMVSGVCAPRAQASVLAIERMGREGNLAGAPAAVEDLREQLDSLIAALNAFVVAASGAKGH